MPMLFIRTGHIGPHVVCCWNDEPPPQDEEARWELVVQTDGTELAIKLFQALKRELAE